MSSLICQPWLLFLAVGSLHYVSSAELSPPLQQLLLLLLLPAVACWLATLVTMPAAMSRAILWCPTGKVPCLRMLVG